MTVDIFEQRNMVAELQVNKLTTLEASTAEWPVDHTQWPTFFTIDGHEGTFNFVRNMPNAAGDLIGKIYEDPRIPCDGAQ